MLTAACQVCVGQLSFWGHPANAMLPPQAPASVLIVHGQPGDPLALDSTLEGNGWVLVKASSGRDALEQVAARDFAAIVLDMRLPDVDGVETAQLIRQRERSRLTPIILVATEARSGADLLDGYALGAVEYVATPFSPQMLRSKVAFLVDVFRNTQGVEWQIAELVRANTRLERAAEIDFQAGLLSAVDQAVIATNIDGTIRYWNRFAETLYGWTAQEVLGKSVMEVMEVTPTSAAFARGVQIMTSLQGGKSWSGEFVVQHRDGTAFPIQVTNSPIRDAAGAITGIIGISIDISERKQTQARLAALVATSEDAIFAEALDGTVTDWNAGAEQLYGYAAAEIVGRPMTCLVPAERSVELADIRLRLDRGERVIPLETVRLRKDGEGFDVSVSTSPVLDADGHLIGAATTTRDISGRMRAEAKLRYQALHDALTGLPNRVLLNDRVEQAIRVADRETLPFALLVLDLDRFKDVNDSLGHQAGDRLLQLIGPRLRSVLRDEDTLARLGGDEFGVLLPGANEDGARAAVAAGCCSC